MSTPGPEGAPPLPGATIADAAAGGMQAALAITAALAGRAHSGVRTYLDVSVADGVLWLMSLDRRAAGSGRRDPSGPRHPLGPLRVLRHLSHRDDKWVAVAAIEPNSLPTSAPPCSAPNWRPHNSTTRRSRACGPPSLGPSLGAPATSGSTSFRGPTPAWRPSSKFTRWPPTPIRRSRHRHDGDPSDGGYVSAAGPAPGRDDRAGCAVLPDMGAGDTDTEHLLKEAGVEGETVARWMDRGVVA